MILSKHQQVSKVKALKGNYQEPTWGDLDKANLIVNGIKSTNKAQLLSAFGTGAAINDLQLCRNASAHLSKDMVAQVNAAKVRYSETKFVHPSDLIFWVDPASKDFLWKTWVDEMQMISQNAII